MPPREPRIYSAEEARALREGRESTGAWDAGLENLYAGHDTCPRHRGDAANQRIRCECRAVARVFKDGDRALCAAAPDLAATVEHLERERDIAVDVERRAVGALTEAAARAHFAEEALADALRRVRNVLTHFGVADCDDPLASLEEVPERADAVVDDEVAHANELTLQVAALRAIVEGRTVAPTMAETAAHVAAGGTFRVTVGRRAYVASTETGVDLAAQDMPGARWWAHDAEGNPCPWPVVAEAPDAPR